MAASPPSRRVLVTRAAHQAGKLSEGLRAAGFEAVEVPVLEIRPPATFAALDRALRQLDGYDWLIFTSANAVRAVVERAAALGISAGSSGAGPEPGPDEPKGAEAHSSKNNVSTGGVLKGHSSSRAASLRTKDVETFAPEGAFPQIAAIGEATAAAARNAGFAVALIPPAYVAESLVQSLSAQAAGKRILLARAEIARDVIPDVLRVAGATVDVVDAYRNVLPESAPALLRAALERGIGAATFTSSSSVVHLAEAARAAGIAFPFAGVRAISIGPITSATLREYGWEPSAEASPSDIPGLIEAARRAQ